MELDLTELHNNSKDYIEIKDTYTIEEIKKESGILSLSPISLKGTITRKENDDLELEDYINAKIEGEMMISDSISLEPISYQFSILYDDFIMENWLKNENTLDILSFLWENIVLEVPLQFTKVRDLSKFHGDGWKLISEEELQESSNPFRELLKDSEEE